MYVLEQSAGANNDNIFMTNYYRQSRFRAELGKKALPNLRPQNGTLKFNYIDS